MSSEIEFRLDRCASARERMAACALARGRMVFCSSARGWMAACASARGRMVACLSMYLNVRHSRLLALCRTPSVTLKRRRSLRTHCVTGRVRDFEPVRAGLGGTRACVSQSRWSRRQTFHDSAKSHSILGKLLGMIAIGGLSDSIVVRAALPACHVLSPPTCGRCHGAVTVVSVC